MVTKKYQGMRVYKKRKNALKYAMVGRKIGKYPRIIKQKNRYLVNFYD